MKKVFFALMLGLAAIACTKEYDDSALKNQLGNLEDRVEAIEEEIATLTNTVNSLKSLAQALNDGKYITSYEEYVGEDGRTGYTLKFSDNSTVVVYNGVKGETGETGETGPAPALTVAEKDGELYWFVGTEALAPVYEAAPVFTSNEGKLYVQFGEQEPVEIGTLTGKSIFEDVKVEGENMVFTFLPVEGETEGYSVSVPLTNVFTLVIRTEVGLAEGATAATLPYTVKGANAATVVDFIAFGCKAALTADAIEVTEIAEGAYLLVFADNQEGKTSIKKVAFAAEAVTVETVDYLVPAEGGQVVVKGDANIDLEVVIPAEATWLTQVATKSAFEFTLVAKDNKQTVTRETEVTLVRKGSDVVFATLKVAQEPRAPYELKRVWGLYSTTAPWYNFGVDASAAINLDRGMAMDTENIYVSKSTAYAPVITAFPLDGGASFNINVTGMGPENTFGDKMTYSVNALRTIKKADGTYVLIACNLKQDGTHVLQVWAWPNGVDQAPVCIGRYAFDSVANADDFRRYGDRFSVSGTWEDGLLWFPSMQADDHGKTIVFKTFEGVDNSNRPAYYYRMEPSRSNMKCYAFYPGSDEVFSTSNGASAFVKLDGTTHQTGWVNWAVTADYSQTHLRTFDYNFFEMNNKKYIAFVKIDEQNGKTGRLVVIEDGDGTIEGFKGALTANTVAWEFPLQHESDFAAEACQVTGNTLGGCFVIDVDDVKYIGAHIQGLGCSLFRFE